MQPHSETIVLTLDLAECLEAHASAIEYLKNYTPFFDVIYSTTVVETLPLQMNYLSTGSEFSRAFLNLYEKVSGAGPEDLPDWVLEHIDALSEATINYLTRYMDFVLTQTPQFESMEIIDVVRTSPTIVSVSAIQVPTGMFKPTISPLEVNRRLDRVEATLQELLQQNPGWSLNGVVQEISGDIVDEPATTDLAQGSTCPSPVAPA